MLALTLWRPWDLLIVHGLKDIENRPWSPGRRLERGARFAIHAGKTFDESCIPTALRLGVPIDFFDKVRPVSHVVGVVTFEGAWQHSTSKWFFGPCGWLLNDAIALQEPVPCRGAQGLWKLPDDVEAAVRRQLP